MSTSPTSSPERARQAPTFSPMVDIEESRDELVLWADLPCVNQDDLRITLEKRVLTIEARVHPDVRETYRLAHQEYQQGDFRRSFTISDAIDEQRIAPTLTNGVLRLVLPKAEPAKPRTIAITVG